MNRDDSQDCLQGWLLKALSTMLLPVATVESGPERECKDRAALHGLLPGLPSCLPCWLSIFCPQPLPQAQAGSSSQGRPHRHMGVLHRGRLTHADHFGSPGSHVFFSRRLRKLWSNLSRAVRQLDAAIVGWPSSLQSLLPCLTCSTARKGFLLLGHQHRCPGGRVSQGLPRPGAQEPPQEGTGCPADVLPRRTGAPSPRDP